jgi:Na+/H+ antiporter NhaD/arsenite permease-like protein
MPVTTAAAVHLTPLWAVLPFVAYLLLIAVLPLVAGHFWEPNRNKLLLGLAVGAPVIAYLLWRPGGLGLLAASAFDYVSFMTLLGALFVISGGIYLKGSLVGSPAVNTTLLAVGATLASLIGTTGASALLIRPLLRANARRPRTTHVFVFFIFIVSNAGGLLTPLGDPPLFLGFLRGVPFTWTFRLAPAWALVNGTLLVLFHVFDRVFFARDRDMTIEPSQAQARIDATSGALATRGLSIEGGMNALWLLGVVLTVFAMGTIAPALIHDVHVRSLVQIVAMATFAGLSLKTTPRAVHEANRFSWGPIVEVAAVFVGIFITMVPALEFLGEQGASLGIVKPWQFFWASGVLSSVLDNAPTYLTFASLANGVADGGHGLMSASNLGALAAHPVGTTLLIAVSCGSVFMGANTYIGNGPNFMVKAIAEQHHVPMPSFFGYTLWSGTILVPLFVIVGLLLF